MELLFRKMIWWNMEFRLVEANVMVQPRESIQLNKVSGSKTIDKRCLKEEAIDPGTAFSEDVVDSLAMVSRGVLVAPTPESQPPEHRPCTLQRASLLCDLRQVTDLSESQYPHL